MALNKSFWKTTGGIAIIATIIGVNGIMIANLIPPLIKETHPKHPPYPSGKILLPRENETVSNSFDVKGELQGIPADHYVWLAIQIGNLIWPKEEIERNAHTWMKTIYEPGESEKSFDIVLFMVKNDGHKEIRDWLRKCMQTRDCPGIEEISNKTVLGVVHVILIGN